MFLDHKEVVGKPWEVIIGHINDLEPEIQILSNDDIKSQIASLKERTELQIVDYELAFALFRESSKRILGLRLYDVQLQGAAALCNGMIAEMKTGEGKTITAACAAFITWLLGRKVHIITTNDYLAERDSSKLNKLYTFLGMSNGLITHHMTPGERSVAYKCDVVYVTNKELGFDYLKDNMKRDVDELIMPSLDFCIIDEADSILIDDATTPLVVSGQIAITSEIAEYIYKLIDGMDPDNFEIDLAKKRALITDSGISKIESSLLEWEELNPKNIYDPRNADILNMINQCIKAKFLFVRDVDYIVRDEKIMIVDHNTGRIASDRRYSDSLHQALEAKEGLPINPDQITLASISYQTFFKLYDVISGMTGTIASDSYEIFLVYNTHVVQIPTNKPVIRKDYQDRVYASIQDKEDAIIDYVTAKYRTKQPVILGTPDIYVSERLSKKLHQKAVPHVVLNAKFPEKEADIISQAGRLCSITIATNIAGRGTDILLGGNPDYILDADTDANRMEHLRRELQAEKEEVVKLGGLCVVGWTRNESRRIDDQLIGRAGRQGDPGESVFFLSLEDKIFQNLESKKLKSLQGMFMQKGEIISHKWITKSIKQAQSIMEGTNSQIRQELVKYDKVIHDQRQIVYENRLQILSSSRIQDIMYHILKDSVKIALLPLMPKNASSYTWNEELIFEACYVNWKISKVTISKILEKNSNREDVVSDVIAFIWNDVSPTIEEHLNTLSDMDKFYKAQILLIFDEYWSAHIRLMDTIRKSIGLSFYASLNPAIEFQKTAFELYHIMIKRVKLEISQLIIDAKYRS